MTGATIRCCSCTISTRSRARFPLRSACPATAASFWSTCWRKTTATPTTAASTRLLLEAYGYRWYRVGGLDYLLKRSDIDVDARRQGRPSGIDSCSRLALTRRRRRRDASRPAANQPDDHALVAAQIERRPCTLLAFPVEKASESRISTVQPPRPSEAIETGSITQIQRDDYRRAFLALPAVEQQVALRRDRHVIAGCAVAAISFARISAL